MRLSGRIALITGASRGLGQAAALAYAGEGAHCVLVARTVGGLEALDDKIRELGGSATLVPLDVTDGTGIDRLGPRSTSASRSSTSCSAMPASWARCRRWDTSIPRCSSA
jgi:NAD(P)-dependent dehydrogenase (short-subunit alcohol dehydrogenase family)